MADKKKYSKVQFLTWEIYTGPAQIPVTEYKEDSPVPRRSFLAVDYPGISLTDDPKLEHRRTAVLDQCIDIEARLAATKRAIEKAYEKASSDASILKIFIAPEFLYRGAAGAYIQDLLNGWSNSVAFPELPAPFKGEWGGLIGGLKSLVAKKEYEDWIFVFGTAIGVAYTAKDGKYIAQNLSYVQRGGENRGIYDCYYAEKHLKSWMDFALFNYDHPSIFSSDEVKHDSRDDRAVLENLLLTDPGPGQPGGAMFRFRDVCRGDGTPLVFGLEICLDHASAKKGNRTGRLANAKQKVDIQLVPSCGMSLRVQSLALTRPDTAYALNCDGFSGTSTGPELGGHVQLWSITQSGGKLAVKKLSEALNSFADGDQSGDPDDPNTSMHFEIGDDDIDLSARLAGIPDFDASHIKTTTLWRGWFNPDDVPQVLNWPQGLGFIRRLPLADL